ncbi:hypothetical protein OC835_006350 [Tilletia horrida]|nr:hypothetical protein OC835_006350 [Tilletia horrida]
MGEDGSSTAEEDNDDDSSGDNYAPEDDPVPEEDERTFTRSAGPSSDLAAHLLEQETRFIPQTAADNTADIDPSDETSYLKYFTFQSSRLVTKHRRKTGKLYQEIDETWLCRLCNKPYTGHPTTKSNLWLHINPKSNANFCKNLYDPLDKQFVGHFKPLPPDQYARGARHRIPAAAISPAASGTSSTRDVGLGSQQTLDGWRAHQRADHINFLTEEVRRLLLKCIVMTNQPFIALKNRHFQDILMALNPSVASAMISARQVRRDLDVIFKSLMKQVSSHIQDHNPPFTVAHDSWTSPSRRFSFLSFVVSYVDVDWTFRQCVIGFEVLRGQHTGATLAGHLIRCLRDNNLLQQWTGILIGDAASANGRMCDALQYEFSKRMSNSTVAELKELVKHRRGDHSIFCFNHALNRAMVDFYARIGVKVKKRQSVLRASQEGDDNGEPQQAEDDDSDSDSDEDDVESDGRAAEHPPPGQSNNGHPLTAALDEAMGSASQDLEGVDAADQEEEDDDPEEGEAAFLYADLRCQLATVVEVDEEDCMDDEHVEEAIAEELEEGIVEDLAAPVNKIALLAKQMHSSSEALRELQDLMAMRYQNDAKLAKIVLPKFNATRWNSRAKQLRIALKIKDGLLFYVKNSNRPKVKALDLTEADFEGFDHISDIVRYMHGLTYEFERSQPHACSVLQAFGDLLHVLDVEIADAERKKGRDAAKLVDGLKAIRDKMRLYQQAASSSETLLLAGVLNPQHRLSTFLMDYKDKVTTVKQLLQGETPAPSPKKKTTFKVDHNKKSKWQRNSAPTAAVPDIVTAEQTEIDAYLANRHEFRVARKFLSAPGSTSEVERVFSRAGRYVSGRRPLGPTALQQLVIGSQLMAQGFDPYTEASSDAMDSPTTARPSTQVGSTSSNVGHTGQSAGVGAAQSEKNGATRIRVSA